MKQLNIIKLLTVVQPNWTQSFGALALHLWEAQLFRLNTEEAQDHPQHYIQHGKENLKQSKR